MSYLRNRFLLISVLILLNIAIRIPSTPHEIGVDSFVVHAMANSISIFGEAKYWINPLAFVGMYPYTYASVVPFFLSGISQLTNIEMETVIQLYGLIVGIFSIFTAYLLAGAVLDDEFFKVIVAFLFSISPGVLTFSTWDATTRGFFMILFPLFIYSLLKIRTSKIKYTILTIVLFIMLIATHHYFYYIIPIIFSFFILILLEKYTKFIKISTNIVNVGFLILLLVFFSFPFFSRSFFDVPRYSFLWRMASLNMRYSGILIPLALAGLTYFSLKKDKGFREWFLLLCILFLAPFMYISIYTHFIAVLFICLLVGIALTNIAKEYEQKKKYIAPIMIISLLLFVGFSGFYQHWRTGISIAGSSTGRADWYMDEATYNGGLWIRDYISQDKKLLGNGGANNFVPKRMLAASGGKPPILTADDVNILAYGFINESEIKIRKTSPLTTEFYMEGPYLLDGFSVGGQLNWVSEGPDIDWKSVKAIIEKFDISYMIEDTDFHDSIMSSVRGKKNNLYDNGYIHIWDIR